MKVWSANVPDGFNRDALLRQTEQLAAAESELGQVELPRAMHRTRAVRRGHSMLA